ncbi:DoxX family protein [Paraflavitalea pollutisoli]|uniref:DoxX family protein n=1 Tax=Paraflavitalea pollutisoli TaxID=3034143 RepID=UPI0023ED1034|nr:DoxX family protein [Paraflavitalea sp. H1-2-19X]
MPNNRLDKPPVAWKAYEKNLFRFFFLYFTVQVFPLDTKFYQYVASINWLHVTYGELFNLAHYTPLFAKGGPTYWNWVIAAGAALAGTIVWTLIDQGRTREYNNWYYWLRVALRYRLSLALLAYGFLMLFPIQAPYPSISHLNTPYGDFTRWKLFSLSLGVVPSYEFFLGLIEVLLALLLLYRKTASLAAFIILIYLGNVFVSNLAYEGGEDIYSLFLLSIAAFLLAWDAQRLYRLLVLQQPTAPNRFQPVYTEAVQYGRVAGKSLFVLVFVVLYGFQTGSGYAAGSYQYPTEPGLSGTAGLYNVSQFTLGEDTLAYASDDPVRWQDVVFETWNTISIRSNRAVKIDSSNTDFIHDIDAARRYELEGAAARHYYSYTVDSLQHTLTLRNRNKHYAGETLVLQYEQPTAGRIVLRGRNYDQTPLLVQLDRIDKKYLLEEAAKAGRR